jgi:hypothetical protein
LVPVSHRNYFFKSPLYMAFPTAADPADRAVSPLSPLPCQAWHGYGVSNAHHGEVRDADGPANAPPSGAAAAAPPAGAAAAIMVASRRQGKVWYQVLTELACHETVLPACAQLFIVPGGGTNAVQSSNLTGPSKSFIFPSGVVVPPPRIGGCHPNHAFNTRHITLADQSYPSRASKVRYKIETLGCNNPWADY